MAYAMKCNTNFDAAHVAKEFRKVIKDQLGVMSCRIIRRKATRLEDAMDIIYIEGGISFKVPHEQRLNRLQKLLDLLESYGHNCGFETITKDDYGRLWLKKAHWKIRKIGELFQNSRPINYVYMVREMLPDNPFKDLEPGIYTYRGWKFQVQIGGDLLKEVVWENHLSSMSLEGMWMNSFYPADDYEDFEEFHPEEEEGPCGGAFRNEDDYLKYRDSSLYYESQRNSWR